jgi:beta-N-acetylglucosaminidase
MEIKDYENYLIYDDGRVYSKKYKRFLKPHLNKQTGYYIVDLYKNSKRKKFLIHRLIALHYIPLVDKKDFVDHIDQNKTNNDISNLRWVDKRENNINRGVQSNNKLGHKNIGLTASNAYQVKIRRNGKSAYNKTFKTLDEAIIGRDNFIQNY